MKQSLVLVSLVATSLSSVISSDAQKVVKYESEGYLDWLSITASTHLKWHPCYERHECARLEVLMDPHNASLHETVAVAVIQDPVKMSGSDSSYGRSIFFDLGGPGGSGIDYPRWAEYEICRKIEGPKHFDPVSWDPCGMMKWGFGWIV